MDKVRAEGQGFRASGLACPHTEDLKDFSPADMKPLVEPVLGKELEVR